MYDVFCGYDVVCVIIDCEEYSVFILFIEFFDGVVLFRVVFVRDERRRKVS